MLESCPICPLVLERGSLIQGCIGTLGIILEKGPSGKGWSFPLVRPQRQVRGLEVRSGLAPDEFFDLDAPLSYGIMRDCDTEGRTKRS
jgi:hypothetical protein